MSRPTLPSLVLLALAGPAVAAPLIVTPAARPPTGGSVRCIVANASPTKTVEIVRTIYSFDGTIPLGPTTFSLLPNRNATSPPVETIQAHCVVEVTKGGKKNVRVSLEVMDAADTVVGFVSGQ